MAERNISTPEDQQIVFRVGVNLGDVINAEDNDIDGDGVNVALPMGDRGFESRYLRR
jgi:adenylate cyclase